MLPEELKRFAIGYSQDIFNAGQEMDTYQEKLKDSIIKFTKRPYTNFIDAKTDEEDFTEWLNDESVKEDMKFLSYIASNKEDVPNFKNLVSQEEYEMMIAKIKVMKDSYIYATCFIELLKDDNYLQGQYNEMSLDEVRELHRDISVNDPRVEMLETMMDMLSVKPFVLDQKARIESSSIVESLKNRKGKITDEEVIDDLEDYEEVIDDNNVNFDRTAKNVYHYFNRNNLELTKEEAQRQIRNGITITRFKGARTEGVAFNVPNEETGKLETRECHRPFEYDMREDMKENIRMLKDLQTDLASTDPWFMTSNSDEFKRIKKSINLTIKAMENCAKYPIDNNMNAVASAMENMHTLVSNYARRKNVERVQSGKDRDHKRYNIAKELQTFSSPEKIRQLRNKVFHIDPAKVVKKLDEKFPKNGNIEDVANYLRGLTELSKMIPNEKESRDDKVGVTYHMAEVLKAGGTHVKERLIREGGMTDKEYKDLEKQFNAGKPTKEEMARNVGDRFLERSGALKHPEEDYDAISVDSDIRILE